jgi:hypothetical protein
VVGDALEAGEVDHHVVAEAAPDGHGDDGTALLESSIKPFKTIMAAINAASVVASDTNRFVIRLSPEVYIEDIVMSNYIAIVGLDIESTVINGTLTYPPTYTDITGAEVSRVTLSQSDAPALIINVGDDSAYIGINSCYLRATYENLDISNKAVVRINRGLAEIYGTTYCELNDTPNNGLNITRHASIFEHTSDPANLGTAKLESFGSSCIATINDDNDVVALIVAACCEHTKPRSSTQ